MEANTETTTTPPATKVRKVAAKPAKKAVKKAAKVTKVAKAEKPATADGDRVPLKAICAKLDIEPRLARRKLRNAELAFHDKRDRWTFTKVQAAKVTEILSA